MANTNELLEQIKVKLDKLKIGLWKDAGIAASGTVSNAVDLGDHYAFVQVIIPTITSAQLELQVSDELNGTYQDKGQDALTKAGTGAYTDTWGLGGWRYIKIKSSVAQTAAVVFQVRGVTDSSAGGVGDISDVDVLSIAAGDNNIGNVDVASIAAGDNNVGNVDIVTVPAPLNVTGGGVELGAIRVTVASDSTGVLSVDDNGGSLTVDVGTALPAGTNAIGKLAANSGVDIGDVDVLSIATGTNAIGRIGHDTTGLGHGVKTVTTVGTDEALAASTACKWVIVQSQTDNTDKGAVGASGVDATVATGNGIILDPGDAVTILTDNLADVYVDVLVAGEGFRYTYGT